MPLIWNGLPYIRQRKLHSLEMPNSFNFAFSYELFAQVRQTPLDMCKGHSILISWNLALHHSCISLFRQAWLKYLLCSVIPVLLSAGWPLHPLTACFYTTIHVYAETAVQEAGCKEGELTGRG